MSEHNFLRSLLLAASFALAGYPCSADATVIIKTFDFSICVTGTKHPDACKNAGADAHVVVSDDAMESLTGESGKLRRSWPFPARTQWRRAARIVISIVAKTRTRNSLECNRRKVLREPAPYEAKSRLRSAAAQPVRERLDHNPVRYRHFDEGFARRDITGLFLKGHRRLARMQDDSPKPSLRRQLFGGGDALRADAAPLMVWINGHLP